MRVRVRLVAVMAVSLATLGCTSQPEATGPTGGATPTEATSEVASTPEATTPSPVPTTPSEAETAADDPLIGVGTATVDGEEVEVSGDCDLSRAFGEEPVPDLDDDVDLLLSVDNLLGRGEHSGTFPLRVTVEGGGPVTGRTVVSTGAITPDGGIMEARYEGTIEVAELRDRQERDFLDVATLHLEASQRVDVGEGVPPRRALVLDVTCAVSRPG